MSKTKAIINELKSSVDNARREGDSLGFGALMERHMKEKKISGAELARASNMSDRTIRRMKGDDMYEPTREMVVAICVAMKLSEDESYELLNKSAYRLRSSSPVDAVYRQILSYEGRYSVNELNDSLYEMKYKLLGGGR